VSPFDTVPREMADPEPRNHLVVLCHGLHGTARSMAAVAEALSKQHSSLLVHISSANTGALLSVVSTARGLLVGGAKLAQEVRDLVAGKPSIRKLSLVGVSLGGLFIRAALPGIREAMPMLPIANFVTFATPHLGVRRHLHRLVDAVVGSGTVVGTTGLHLLMRDKDGAGGMPLLQWMADPRSPYWQALATVQNRVLVANLLVDDKVPHWSAALACNDAVLPRIAASRPDLVECIYSAAGDKALTRAPRLPSGSPVAAIGAGGAATSSPSTSMAAFPHIAAVYQEPPVRRHWVTDAACAATGAPHVTGSAGAATPSTAAAPGVTAAGAAGTPASPSSALGCSPAEGTVAATPRRRLALGIGPPALAAAAAGGAHVSSVSAAELMTVLFAAARADDKPVVHDETSPEAAMMVGLRSMGGWINVDVLFTEPLALPLNHLRIAVSAPGIAWHGQDVLRFVAQHVFLVGPD